MTACRSITERSSFSSAGNIGIRSRPVEIYEDQIENLFEK